MGSPTRSESGKSDSGSSGGSSVGSRSRSASPAGSSPARQKSRSASPEGSPKAKAGSRSPSPAGSSPRKAAERSGSESPASSRGKPSPKSGSASPVAVAQRSRSGSPVGSKSSRSRSGSSSGASGGEKSRSPSPDQVKKPSKPRSRSHSRSSSGSGSRSASPAGSASPKGVKSRSASPAGSNASRKSRSASPVDPRSAKRNQRIKSDSVGSKSSRSGSSSGSSRSRSGSPASKSSRSRSGSPKPTKKSDKKPEKASEFFGDADDLSSSDSERGKEPEPIRRPTEKWVDDRVKSDEEEVPEKEEAPEKPEVEEPEEIPETRIDVDIPKITTDLGKGIHFVKLPNFLSVETRPFDPNTYEDEIDDEETLDEEGRARLKLKVENTIRWRERFNDKGVFVKESNSRFVRWSDGSLSLHLGDEIFNVYKQPLQGDHNHLFIRQGTGLQGQAVFRTKLTFRPHSTESFTHRKMTMSLADRSSKTTGIKVLSTVGLDPEQHRDEMIKQEEDRLRATVKRESKRRRVRESLGARGLSKAYLDDDISDDENAISLSKIKNKFKRGEFKSANNIYSSDEEEEKEGAVAIVDDDDDESDLEPSRKREKRRLRVSDEDDEDEETETPAKTAEETSEPAAVTAGAGSDDE